MNRLTSVSIIKDSDGNAKEQFYCFGHLWGPSFFKKGTKDYEEYLTIVKRLAEYEDIGTPEECRRAMEKKTDDIEKLFTGNCDGCKNTNTDECMHCMRAYSDCYEEREESKC